jgi:dihydroorotase
MTAGAALYGLPTPAIIPGARANLCLVDLEAQSEVGAGGYVSKSCNCCFHGRMLRGRVLLTLAGGQIAHREPVLAEVRSLSAR